MEMERRARTRWVDTVQELRVRECVCVRERERERESERERERERVTATESEHATAFAAAAHTRPRFSMPRMARRTSSRQCALVAPSASAMRR
jgi:hypothetical protein